MTDSNKSTKFSKYFISFLHSEINIKKEDIFYRDKYNEIINYIKVLLTNSKSLEFYNYLKPKGTLLINVQPGTDILDYLKLISSNYYLEYNELNLVEIKKSPDDFFNHFTEILENFSKERKLNREKEKKIEIPVKNKEKIKDEISEINEINKKKLILINEHHKLDKSFNQKTLLNNFINYFQANYKKINFIDRNLILIWINYDYEEIIENSNELFNIFDLFIKVPLLNKIERETVLRNFSEKNPKISFDINAIVNYTENWEVNDLNQLIKIGIFKHALNADLNNVSNEITDILISLIESGEYIPSKTVLTTLKNLNEQEQEGSTKGIQNKRKERSEIKEIRGEIIKYRENLVNQIRTERVSEFLLNQLYENAASKNYNELILIIDKLNKKELIEENDRKILAKYPFILNDSPQMAQINLEKAKKRIDLMKQAFGK